LLRDGCKTLAICCEDQYYGSTTCAPIQGGLKVGMFIVASNFVCCQPASIFLAHIHCMKLATGGYIVSPPNTVYVIALPCKILIMTLFMMFTYQYIKQSTYYFDSNNVIFCQNCMKIFLKESYKTNITYLNC